MPLNKDSAEWRLIEQLRRQLVSARAQAKVDRLAHEAYKKRCVELDHELWLAGYEIVRLRCGIDRQKSPPE